MFDEIKSTYDTFCPHRVLDWFSYKSFIGAVVALFTRRDSKCECAHGWLTCEHCPMDMALRLDSNSLTVEKWHDLGQGSSLYDTSWTCNVWSRKNHTDNAAPHHGRQSSSIAEFYHLEIREKETYRCDGRCYLGLKCYCIESKYVKLKDDKEHTKPWQTTK